MTMEELAQRLEQAEQKIEALEETLETLKKMGVSEQMQAYIDTRQRTMQLTGLLNTLSGQSVIDTSETERQIMQAQHHKESVDRQIREAIASASMVNTNSATPAAAAAEAEPEIAPKSAFVPMFVTRRAPGSFPRIAITKSTNFLAIPPWFIKLPARMKKGIAVKLNLLIPTKVRCAAVTTDTSRSTVCRITANEEIPMEYAIGTPKASSTKSTTKIMIKDSIAIYAASFSFTISIMLRAV